MTFLRGRFKLQGCLVALSGAFVWVYFYTIWTGFDASLFAGFAVLVASWFVIPLGIGLGVLLPRIVSKRSSSKAFIQGGAVGIGVALIVGELTKPLGHFDDYSHVLSMIMVCFIWVGLWAMLIARAGIHQSKTNCRPFRNPP